MTPDLISRIVGLIRTPDDRVVLADSATGKVVVVMNLAQYERLVVAHEGGPAVADSRPHSDARADDADARTVQSPGIDAGRSISIESVLLPEPEDVQPAREVLDSTDHIAALDDEEPASFRLQGSRLQLLEPAVESPVKAPSLSPRSSPVLGLALARDQGPRLEYRPEPQLEQPSSRSTQKPEPKTPPLQPKFASTEDNPFKVRAREFGVETAPEDRDLSGLTQQELLDKINRDIGDWKTAQERKRTEELAASARPERASAARREPTVRTAPKPPKESLLEEEERFYLEPIE